MRLRVLCLVILISATMPPEPVNDFETVVMIN